MDTTNPPSGLSRIGLNNACGYTMGISYPPSWMDWPMLWTGNADPIEEGMVFFLHMILLDDRTGLTMSLGETVRSPRGPASRSATRRAGLW